jgi:hypothetical protein
MIIRPFFFDTRYALRSTLELLWHDQKQTAICLNGEAANSGTPQGIGILVLSALVLQGACQIVLKLVGMYATI